MYNKIRDHVEFLFQGAPVNARAVELKEEMISSLMDRYSDLIAQGETEEAAYGIVIGSIGDVDELIRGLREQQTWDPSMIQSERHRSALLVSVAVGLFVFSPVFLIMIDTLWGTFLGNILRVLGPFLTLLCIAIGVGLLVYNSRTKTKYVKMEETIVEDFKEWNQKKQDMNTLSKAAQSIIYTATVPIYLILGFFFPHGWSRGWLVFLIAPCAAQIVKLVLLYKEES